MGDDCIEGILPIGRPSVIVNAAGNPVRGHVSKSWADKRVPKA